MTVISTQEDPARGIRRVGPDRRELQRNGAPEGYLEIYVVDDARQPVARPRRRRFFSAFSRCSFPPSSRAASRASSHDSSSLAMSIVQLIYMSEVDVLLLKSPRTVVALPVVAAIAHFVVF